jgi:hypothetical protein
MLYNNMNKSTYLKITVKTNSLIEVRLEMQNLRVKTMVIMSEVHINK